MMGEIEITMVASSQSAAIYGLPGVNRYIIVHYLHLRVFYLNYISNQSLFISLHENTWLPQK